MSRRADNLAAAWVPTLPSVPSLSTPPAPGNDPGLPPPSAVAALASLQGARARSEVEFRQVSAPRRLAPFAVAYTAEVADDLAHGRLVVLHDPDGQDGWAGPTRLVAHVSATLEADMAADPLLAPVAWSWLLDALSGRGAGHAATAGTVTRTASARFGAMTGEPDEAQVEIRASWSPLDEELGRHLEAWTDLLCLAAGLPPPGVVALPQCRPSR